MASRDSKKHTELARYQGCQLGIRIWTIPMVAYVLGAFLGSI